jgi:DNA-binding CsgD family transcriptional regulator
MGHLAIFVLVLSLPLGVISIYQLWQAYKKYQQRYLFTYAVMLILMNGIVILGLVNDYLFVNILERYASPAAIIWESIFRFLAALLNIVFAWVFVVLCRKLLMKKLTTLFKVLYFGTGVPLVLALIFYFIYSLATMDVFPTLMVNWIAISLVTNVVLWAIIYLLKRNRKVEDKGKQTAIRLFGTAMLWSYSAVVLASFLLVFQLTSRSVFPLGVSVFLLVLYGMPVFYLKRFMETYHGPLEKDFSKKDHMEELFRKYNISPREQEIVRLICKAKTNKQIEDELVIALQTVKDHVSRIYGKTGAKNRVQLTNLFRD